MHFAEKEAREKALIPAMRIFGVKIRDCLCRTEPAENKRTLFVGNIDRGVTGDEVSEELNALLKPQLQVEASEASSGVDRTARCAVAWSAHDFCGLLLHRVRLPPAGEHVVRVAVRSSGERKGAEGGMGAGVERLAKKEARAQVGQVSSVGCLRKQTRSNSTMNNSTSSTNKRAYQESTATSRVSNSRVCLDLRRGLTVLEIDDSLEHGRVFKPICQNYANNATFRGER